MHRLPLLLLLLLLPACELSEITTANVADIVIAEVVLRAGDTIQTAYLHRTATANGTARVHGAQLVVRDIASGASFEYDADADSLCLSPAPPPGEGSTGTCYVARGDAGMVRAGARYALRIELDDGGVMSGATTVPADFTIVQPGARVCTLQPMTTLELTWTRSAGTSVYIVGGVLRDVRQALRAAGVDIPPGPDVELFGLSVTGADTTLVFPSELGLFNRFDEELHPVLIAIRDGLPPGVVAEIGVAAADQNYVNWVRGGTFNPSGMVRISSLDGDGHGVFGSENVRHVTLRTLPPVAGAPPCR